MTPDTSIMAKLLHVKGMHIEKVEVGSGSRTKGGETWSFEKIVVHARPYERLRGICPKCGKHCPGYDTKYKDESTWRGPNLNGTIVEVVYQPKRIECSEWIDTCVKQYFPNAKRCIDFFHVVSWVNEALDQTRRNLARKAQQEYKRTKDRIDKEIQERKRAERAAREGYIDAQRELHALKSRRGRPSRRRMELEAKIAAYEEEFNGAEPLSGERGQRGKYTGEQLSMLDALEQNANQIKGVKYALTMFALVSELSMEFDVTFDMNQLKLKDSIPSTLLLNLFRAC